MSNEHLIPELAPYWQKLDFPELLSRPAAFLSIAQNNCVYTPGGKLYGERHDLRGSLPATVRAVRAARKSDSFRSFNWVGYSEYRDDYPKSALDEVQYAAWTDGDDADAEQIAWDNELVPELREIVEPGDNEFFEVAFQSAFIGTQLPLELTRKRIEVIVITGTHLDWCVEGNARAARDFGYVPIVIGDATGAETVEQEEAAFERINRYFAPVITAHPFVEFLGFDDNA
jgi:nicotinamidase-related amidase